MSGGGWGRNCQTEPYIEYSIEHDKSQVHPDATNTALDALGALMDKDLRGAGLGKLEHTLPKRVQHGLSSNLYKRVVSKEESRASAG